MCISNAFISYDGTSENPFARGNVRNSFLGQCRLSIGLVNRFFAKAKRGSKGTDSKKQETDIKDLSKCMPNGIAYPCFSPVLVLILEMRSMRHNARSMFKRDVPNFPDIWDRLPGRKKEPGFSDRHKDWKCP